MNIVKNIGVNDRPVTNADLVQLGVENFNAPQLAVSRDAFFNARFEIDITRWNKLYPYQLVIVKAHDDGTFTPTPSRFTLPMTPQDLSITTPFAITTTVTSSGVAEEHNGTKVKLINLSGSLGSAPLRGTAPIKNLGPGVMDTIFGGTIDKFARLKDSSIALFKGDELQKYKNQMVVSSDVKYADQSQTTGYSQYLLLKQFLEGYASLKTTADGSPYRLAFCIWKENTVYLVTPLSYALKRTVSSPGEYSYDLQFKAWRQVELTLQSASDVGGIIKASPKTLGDALKKIQQARQVIYDTRATIMGFRGDIDRVFNAIREVVLGAKEALGAVEMLVDLPATLIQDFKDQIIRQFHDRSSDPTLLGDRAAKEYLQVMGVNGTITGGGLGTKTFALDSNPITKFFERPDDHYDLFASVDVDRLDLPSNERDKVEAERARVNAFTRSDYEERRDLLTAFLVDYSNFVGAGDDTFNQVYGTTATPTVRTPTDDDFQVIFSLNEIVSEMDKLIALKGDGESELVKAIDYVAGLASGAGVAFQKPVSKFAVPFPYDTTLERLSDMYLGSPDRWHEIAVLNGLREPYIDEVGFDRPLLANGSGNEIVVADASNLYIDQPVWLQASSTVISKRHIVNIVRNLSSTTIVLDGDPDLSRYTITNAAKLHAYLPETINSQMMVYIPSDLEPLDKELSDLAIPGVDKFDRLLDVAGTDLLLTSNNDIIITPDGDSRIAYGLNNLVQRVRIVLSTPRGSLLRHPGFGLPLTVGQSLADMSASDLADISKTLFADDPAFNAVNTISVVNQGPAVSIALGLDVVGQEQPISVAIQTYK